MFERNRLKSNVVAGDLRLSTTVGNNFPARPEDTLQVRNALQSVGFTDQRENGLDFMTRSLDDGIRDFQRAQNLRVDGRINPDGETQRALNQTLNQSLISASSNSSEDDGSGSDAPPRPPRKPERDEDQPSPPESPPKPPRKPEQEDDGEGEGDQAPPPLPPHKPEQEEEDTQKCRALLREIDALEKQRDDALRNRDQKETEIQQKEEEIRRIKQDVTVPSVPNQDDQEQEQRRIRPQKFKGKSFGKSKRGRIIADMGEIAFDYVTREVKVFLAERELRALQEEYNELNDIFVELVHAVNNKLAEVSSQCPSFFP